MDLVTAGVQDDELGMREARGQLVRSPHRHHSILASVDDLRGRRDLRQPVAAAMVADRLVLAMDGEERHLAEMPRIVLDPFGMVADERGVVELRIATQRVVAWQRRGVGGAFVVHAAAVRCDQDQAANRCRLHQRQLLEDHPAERNPEPVRGLLAHR